MFHQRFGVFERMFRLLCRVAFGGIGRQRASPDRD
jgi:hypothetical protein